MRLLDLFRRPPHYPPAPDYVRWAEKVRDGQLEVPPARVVQEMLRELFSLIDLYRNANQEIMDALKRGEKTQ